ncbi:hypothetical protein BG015_000220 [Linnemannia schmuckeri]|uniref:Zincin n=1 Tax=Linnemannia schmuckeri TaxID=64567 RepID=A0A9P5S6W2_9FUNG|nr:hypothetical protein BG015_000220 [Linnemannia schmuckeri]
MVAAKIQLLMAIGVALSVVQAGPIDNNHGSKPTLNNKAICTTPQCVLTASGIINDMDPTADPCQDFSKFTCGGFDEQHEIPSDGSSIGPFDILNASNKRVLRYIVDASLGKSPKAAPGDVAAQNNIKKLQDLFVSCMDEASILKAGRKPLVDEVQKIIQSFPASTSPANKATLSKTLAQITKLGFRLSTFINLSVGSDSANPLVNVLAVYEDGLGLGTSDDYKDAELVKLYQDTAAAMFQVVFGEEDVAKRTQPLAPKDIKKEWVDAAKEVVDFEIQLAGIATPINDLWDPIKSNNPRTVEQLAALTPSIDWPVLIQETLPAGVKNSRPVAVSSVAYLTKLDAILQKTSAKTLQHYFSWLVIQNLANHLGKPYTQPLDVYNSVISGVSADIKVERWKTCVSVVNRNLGQMAGHYFVEQTFKGNSRKEVMSIMENVLASYGKSFPTLKWLDKTTRDGAIKKLKAIVQLVGYSTDAPDVASSKALDEYFKGYTVAANDYFGNQFKYSGWSATDTFRQLPLPVNKNSMSMVPATVNAYYSPSSNSINFPAGILQLPFFNVENPEYINYGSMGVIGGHEIGHAFDNTGRHYDSIGRIENWWTNATSKAFDEKAQCYVNQYGNFTIKGPDGKDHNLDGQLTLGENLADNGGIKMAFRVWQSRAKSDPNGKKIKNFKLPGLDKYTPEQLFFIAYGRLWCNKMRPAALLNLVRTNPHSPAKWRINGVAQNSPDFAKAFKCKAGSPMNPANKCEVW